MIHPTNTKPREEGTLWADALVNDLADVDYYLKAVEGRPFGWDCLRPRKSIAAP